MEDPKQHAIDNIRFSIFDALIAEMPAGSYSYLEKAADIASKAVNHPHFKWAIQELAKEE